MYYFIPAWYGQHRPFYSESPSWHSMSDKIEFDDTINQIRVFQETKTLSKLIVLQYFPQLRYFLHRQDILEIPSVNMFDIIQKIPNNITIKMLDLEDFEWSEKTEFVYTPFLVMVYENGIQIGIVNYGVDGNILKIVLLKNNQRTIEYVIDDRGFISSEIYYEDNKPKYQNYLTYDGVWIIKECLDGEQHVSVNPKFSSDFKKLNYDSMEDLVFEKFSMIESSFSESDTVVIASSDVHNSKIIANRKSKSKTVFSFFSDRVKIENTLDTRVWSYTADLIVTDSIITKRRLLSIDPFFADKTHRISSFDTRLQLGSSQQLKESKIYFFIKSFEIIREDEIRKILEIVEQDKLINVVFALYNASVFEVAQVEETVDNIISKYFNLDSFEVKDLEDDEKADGIVNEPLFKAPPVYRFSVKNFSNEIGVIRELEFTRLIVDLADEPDLYTQIAGISAGIPQINRVESEYVEHLKNGYVLSDINQLQDATDYYLKTLKPWNESLIYSVDKIKENTGYKMIQKWEKWLGKN